jgi:hypothetical protein
MGFEYAKPGIGNVGSYQISGVPFVTGTLTVPANTASALEVAFPSVTKKVIVHLTKDKEQLRVGFSANGVQDTNYFLLDTNGHGRTGFIELEVKCDKIFLLSNNGDTVTATVAAELTGIQFFDLTATYSGSAGVG